jgi:flavin reductase (DIM6/NTAB) family NADH-FMN oxidoreductase RutF
MSAELGDLVAEADGAMVVVTTRSASSGERDGCLVGFHSQSSIDPPRYAVWLSTANRTRRLAADATHLAVHFLATADHELAEWFGGVTGDDLADDGDGKLAPVAWTEGPGGVPVLDAVAHRFVGRIVGRPETTGDHACFELEPVTTDAPERADGPYRLSDASDIDAGHPA